MGRTNCPPPGADDHQQIFTTSSRRGAAQQNHRSDANASLFPARSGDHSASSSIYLLAGTVGACGLVFLRCQSLAIAQSFLLRLHTATESAAQLASSPSRVPHRAASSVSRGKP